MTLFDEIFNFAGVVRDGVVKMAFLDISNLIMKRTIKKEIIILLLQQVKIGAYSRVLVSTDFLLLQQQTDNS